MKALRLVQGEAISVRVRQCSRYRGSKYQGYLYMKVLRLVQGEAISVRVRKCSSYREVLSIKGICI